MGCLFGHQWEGDKCARCGRTRSAGNTPQKVPSAECRRLIADLQGSDWSKRLSAIEVLGQTGEAAAAEALAQALHDSENIIIKYAAGALAKTAGSAAIEPLLDVMRSYRSGDYTGVNGAIDALGSLGEAAVPRLLELADSEIGMPVMRALAKTGSPRALARLTTEATNTHEGAYHRSLMVDGIGRIGGEAAVEALMALLDTARDEAVVKAIVRNLEKLGIGGDDLEQRKHAAQRASAQKLLDGLRAIQPGMSEAAADALVGGANFGMGEDQVHDTRFGTFQLIVRGGVVCDTLYVPGVVEKLEKYLKEA